MKMLQRLLSLSVVLLAACGGGGGDKGTAPFGSGGTPPGTAAAADISLTLSKSTLSNSGTETVTATVTAVDANRNTVAGIPITVSVDNDATVAVSGTITDDKGVVTGAVGIGSSRANRVVLVTAVSGALSRQIAVQVTGARLTATAVPAVLAPSQAGVVQYRVVDATGNALSNIDITVTGPGGAQSTSKTGTSGELNYTYTAPAAAGNLDIRAASAGVELLTTVVIQSGPGSIPTVPAGSVRSASVSANPSVVAVNSATTSINRAEVRALFVGSANTPIPNVRVRFDLGGDLNSIGGTFTTGSNIVYSNVSGIASAAYIPGVLGSPTNGVTVRACWDYQDFAPGACPNAAVATLTVIADALSVSIGTDENIILEDLVYVKRFVIQVNDSSGLAKSDVLVSPLLDLPSYRKGFYTFVVDTWIQTVSASTCENEDINRNGILEVYANGGNEDANANARLDPRKADVAVAFEGSNRTNASGQVILRIVYARSFGSWLRFNLTVAASGVSGTEGRATFAGTLPVPATALKATGAPAFQLSPYGTQASPVVVVTTPDGSASASLCTNPN